MQNIFQNTSICGHFRSKLCFKFLICKPCLMYKKSIHLCSMRDFLCYWEAHPAVHLPQFKEVNFAWFVWKADIYSNVWTKMSINWHPFKYAKNVWTSKKFNEDEILSRNTYQLNVNILALKCYIVRYYSFLYKRDITPENVIRYYETPCKNFLGYLDDELFLYLCGLWCPDENVNNKPYIPQQWN